MEITLLIISLVFYIAVRTIETIYNKKRKKFDTWKYMRQLELQGFTSNSKEEMMSTFEISNQEAENLCNDMREYEKVKKRVSKL